MGAPAPGAGPWRGPPAPPHSPAQSTAVQSTPHLGRLPHQPVPLAAETGQGVLQLPGVLCTDNSHCAVLNVFLLFTFQFVELESEHPGGLAGGAGLPEHGLQDGEGLVQLGGERGQVGRGEPSLLSVEQLPVQVLGARAAGQRGLPHNLTKNKLKMRQKRQKRRKNKNKTTWPVRGEWRSGVRGSGALAGCGAALSNSWKYPSNPSFRWLGMSPDLRLSMVRTVAVPPVLWLWSKLMLTCQNNICQV